MDKYGSIKSKQHVDSLHETIRPYMLRRLKEDVEKSVPPKEEIIIEVELTTLQKKYYRALYEKNLKFLHGNKKATERPTLNVSDEFIDHIFIRASCLGLVCLIFHLEPCDATT